MTKLSPILNTFKLMRCAQQWHSNMVCRVRNAHELSALGVHKLPDVFFKQVWKIKYINLKIRSWIIISFVFLFTAVDQVYYFRSCSWKRDNATGLAAYAESSVCIAEELCKRNEGTLLEPLHTGPLKPCYATGTLTTLKIISSNIQCLSKKFPPLNSL